MDAFSEVLSGVRLKGAMFFSAEFSAPWRLSTPHCRVLAPALAPEAPHIVVYHFVVEGTARARVEGKGISHPGSDAARVVTVSIGAATLVPDPWRLPTALIERADRALYLAKASGRNCVRAEA